MQRVYTKPSAKEILIKGSSKDGSVDLFSYDGNGSGRSLGNLYVVGNINSPGEVGSEDIDVGYVLNLVASLAKREYYSDPDQGPKDAFSNALKKINGVVEEFFKSKDTKINIGIFAVAGDQIHISKLGKFKIFLARDGKNIDILNNIQLFNKESTQEREFSNIISGKVAAGDRLLAFYPGRSVTAREKNLKDTFISSPQEQFAAKLASIKEEKPEFCCAAFHIDIQKATETLAEDKGPQPKELGVKAEPAPEVAAVETMPEPEPVAQVAVKRPAEPPIPNIIPSEFAKGKREIALSKHIRRIKNMNFSPRGKAVSMGGIAIVAIIAIVTLKSFVFVNASTKQINGAVSEARSNLKLAQEKVSQDSLIEARDLLTGSLASITQAEASNGSSKKTEEARSEIIKVLDSLDQAQDATLSVIAEIPLDSGLAQLAALAGNNLHVFVNRKTDGAILNIKNGIIEKTTPVSGLTPQTMFASENYLALVDSLASKIAAISLNKSTVSISGFTSDPLVSYEVYNDNLYGLTQSGIIKISDAALGHSAVQPWLAKDATLPTDPVKIAVDGNIHILNKKGELTTYYKGKEISKANTGVAAESASLLLTNTDSPNLYLVNTSSGRIYVIAKNSGAVSKTLKINSAQTVTSAALGADDSIYILSDNKVWQVK